MKDKSKKHDHKGTKILKLSIFASIMLAPLFAIGFKCAYATFNKNAYQSYSDGLVENQIQVTNPNQLQEGALLQINYNALGNDGYSNIFYFDQITLNLQDILGANYDSSLNYNQIRMRYDGSRGWLYFKDENNTVNQSVEVWGTDVKQFAIRTIDPITNGYTTDLTLGKAVYYQYQYKNKTLDNAFYYAVNQMKDNELFAWTKNTALYTPINAMTSGLGITTDAISVLLAYWLYITLIYVVFDIVIELFTYLSHLIMGNPIG